MDVGKEQMSQPTGGNKMSVLNLEDVIVEAATALALSGECDVPVDNDFGGCDVFLPGAMDGKVRGALYNGVRFAIEDGTVHVYKFERFGVVARASFSGSFSTLSSVLVVVAKEWLA
jgi:hypothetical protein